MLVEYSSNNSGGFWWLEDKDWYALEKAGWTINWVKDCDHLGVYVAKNGRWLGALATSATIEVPSVKIAIESFEEATGQDATDGGCNCCGPPHSFSWEEPEWGYCSGEECAAYLYGEIEVGLSYRDLYEHYTKTKED